KKFSSSGVNGIPNHTNSCLRIGIIGQLNLILLKKYVGARNHHIIALLKHLNKYLTPNYFNVIICNGIFFKGAIDSLD
ncbi:MAG: hypothetical protein ACKPA7_11465, partial [Sphaerospermopsis kisseleviana]